MKFTTASITLLATVLLFFSSCEKEPVIPNEEEVITTLTFTLTPTGGGTPVVFTYQDLDGDGGNAPVITNGTLDTNASYTAALVLTNEQETPAEDITTEIAAESDEHQFFFETNVSGLTVAYNDTDANGKPIGLATNVTTGAAGTGTLKITLRHQPDKDAANVSTGDITNAGGETDIEVTFTVNVQ